MNPIWIRSGSANILCDFSISHEKYILLKITPVKTINTDNNHVLYKRSWRVLWGLKYIVNITKKAAALS